MSSKAVCVVMNTPIDKKTARSKQMVRKFKNKEYFLCCQSCVTAFDKNPAAYTDNKGGLHNA
jgi:YHS domain-containing protein